MAKSIPVSKLKRSVTATQPNINGIAPGKAPIKPEIGVEVFNGVYPTTYINEDNAPKKAHRKLIIERKKTPNNPKNKEKIKALFSDILLVGRGRFLVLSINLSILTS